jgi:hypothetical protein
MKALARVLAAVGVCVGLTVVTPADAAYRLAQGSTVRDKGMLRAGADGAVLAFQSGLTVRLAPGAEFRQHKDTDLWLDGVGKAVTELFTLQSGRADIAFAPPNGAKRAVMVRTSRSLMAATSRGEMTVLAQDSGVVATSAGRVQVSTGGEWTEVPLGQAAIAARGAKVALRALPEAPRLLDGRKLWMAPQGSTAVGGLEWAKSERAESYRVTVSNRETGEVAAEKNFKASALPEDAFQLGGGLYTLRAQALDEFGLAGPYSEARDITVVGVVEHRASRVDKSGTIHVGLNQRVQFTNVTGLLMSYGVASPWAPASSSLMLHRQERTRVHFRLPESSEVVSVVVEPRGVVADVYVGSKLATWPNEAVQVSIRLRDESGAGELSGVEPKIEVRLGITPLAIDFRREGNQFLAEVPPQAGPGPWVLRVTVQDQYGVELGRDFLEVVERRVAASAGPTKALAVAAPEAGAR